MVEELDLQPSASEFLSPHGWLAMGAALRFQCVGTPEQVETLAQAFIDTRDQSEHTQNFDRIRACLQTIAKKHPTIPFRDLLHLSKFLVQITNDMGPDCPSSIDIFTEKILQAPAGARALETACIFARLYCEPAAETPSHRYDLFKHRARVALRSAEIFPNKLIGSFLIHASGLPRDLANLLSRGWQELYKNLAPTHDLSIQVEMVVAAVSTIDRYLTMASSSRVTPQLLVNALVGSPDKAKWIADTVLFLLSRPEKAEGDVEILFKRLNCTNPFPALQRRVEFARLYDLGLGEVAEAVEAIPTEWAQRTSLQPITDERNGAGNSRLEKRALKDLLPLVELLGELLGAKNNDESRFNLDHILNIALLYDRVKNSEQIWSAPVACKVTIRFLGMVTRGFFDEAIQPLRVALELHDRLIHSGHDKRDAMHASVAIALNPQVVGNPQFKGLIEALFSDQPSTKFLTAMRLLAKERSITDEQLLEALSFAAEALPEEWRLHESNRNGFRQSQRLPLPMIREGLRSPYVSSTRELLEVVTIQDQRALLLNFLTSPNEQERKRAGEELTAQYNLDTGPFPVWRKTANGEELHPKHIKMAEEVRRSFLGNFDIHYGFSHLDQECFTAPGSKDWLMTRFGLDCGVRVDRLNTNFVDRYPGPGIMISGIRVDRVLARNPETPDDPYALFKKAWPWAVNAIEDLPYTRFLFTRAVQAYIPPSSHRYQLDGVHFEPWVAFKPWRAMQCLSLGIGSALYLGEVAPQGEQGFGRACA